MNLKGCLLKLVVGGANIMRNNLDLNSKEKRVKLSSKLKIDKFGAQFGNKKGLLRQKRPLKNHSSIFLHICTFWDYLLFSLTIISSR